MSNVCTHMDLFKYDWRMANYLKLQITLPSKEGGKITFQAKYAPLKQDIGFPPYEYLHYYIETSRFITTNLHT